MTALSPHAPLSLHRTPSRLQIFLTPSASWSLTLARLALPTSFVPTVDPIPDLIPTIQPIHVLQPIPAVQQPGLLVPQQPGILIPQHAAPPLAPQVAAPMAPPVTLQSFQTMVATLLAAYLPTQTPPTAVLTHAVPSSPHPTSYAGPAHSFSTVQSFYNSLSRIAWDGTGASGDASSWFDKLIMMITRFGFNVGQDFTNSLIYAFTGSALTWLMNILPTSDTWSPSSLKEKFMARFAGQVRNPHAVALGKLVHRHIFMSVSESVELYAERFPSVSRLVPDITGSALCQYYISGLTDQLRVRCVLTNFNKEWVSLDELMTHSFAENLRLTLMASSPYRQGS